MLPNVLQPREADHVPVLAEEVRAGLAVQPGRDGHRRDLRRRRARLAPRRRPARQGKLIAIDRDPTARTYFEQLAKRATVNARLLRGDFGVVLPQLAGERRPRRRDPARPRRLVDAARPAGARLLVRGRRAARHADGSDAGARAPRDLVNTWSERDLVTIFRTLRRGAVREADRAGDRAPPARSSRSSGRASSWTRSRPRSRRRRGSAKGIPRSASSRRCGSRSTTSSTRSRLRCRRRSRCCGRAAASPSSPSTRSRTGSSSGSSASASAAARARPTSPSASAATSRSSARCSGGRSARARPSSRRTRARRRRACALPSRPEAEED